MLSTIPNYEGSITRFSEDELLNNFNFYDYDGTLLYSFTPKETKKLLLLPPVPTTHPRFFKPDWNWTLSQAQIGSNMGDASLVYDTVSGKTEFDISLTQATDKTVQFSSSVVIDDWGDGSTDDNFGYSHTYENYGDYTLKCSNTVLPTAVIGNTESTPDKFLVNAFVSSNVIKVEQGAFNYCHNLRNLMICETTTTEKEIASHEMYSMDSFFCHRGSYASTECVKNNNKLTRLSITYAMKTIKSSSFENCSSVKRITFGNVATIEEKAFSGMSSCRIFDFTRCLTIPTLKNVNAFENIPVDFKILVPTLRHSQWISNAMWSNFADRIYPGTLD